MSFEVWRGTLAYQLDSAGYSVAPLADYKHRDRELHHPWMGANSDTSRSWWYLESILAKRSVPFAEAIGPRGFRTHLTRSVILRPGGGMLFQSREDWERDGRKYGSYVQYWCGNAAHPGRARLSKHEPENAQLCFRCIAAAGLMDHVCDLGLAQRANGYYCIRHPAVCVLLPRCSHHTFEQLTVIA